MIWTICGELYPTRYRAKAMALSTASNWFWNFMLAFFTPCQSPHPSLSELNANT
jgi:hypothetical protein